MYSKEVLLGKLDKLNGSAQSIQTLSHWITYHYRNAPTSIATWEQQLYKVSTDRLLSYFYLANDVIQNSKKKGEEISTEFSKIITPAIFYIYTNGNDKTKEAVQKTLKLWNERKIYPAEKIAEIQSCITTAASPSNATPPLSLAQSTPPTSSSFLSSPSSNPITAPFAPFNTGPLLVNPSMIISPTSNPIVPASNLSSLINPQNFYSAYPQLKMPILAANGNLGLNINPPSVFPSQIHPNSIPLPIFTPNAPILNSNNGNNSINNSGNNINGSNNGGVKEGVEIKKLMEIRGGKVDIKQEKREYLEKREMGFGVIEERIEGVEDIKELETLAVELDHQVQITDRMVQGLGVNIECQIKTIEVLNAYLEKVNNKLEGNQTLLEESRAQRQIMETHIKSIQDKYTKILHQDSDTNNTNKDNHSNPIDPKLPINNDFEDKSNNHNNSSNKSLSLSLGKTLEDNLINILEDLRLIKMKSMILSEIKTLFTERISKEQWNDAMEGILDETTRDVIWMKLEEHEREALREKEERDGGGNDEMEEFYRDVIGIAAPSDKGGVRSKGIWEVMVEEGGDGGAVGAAGGGGIVGIGGDEEELPPFSPKDMELEDVNGGEEEVGGVKRKREEDEEGEGDEEREKKRVREEGIDAGVEGEGDGAGEGEREGEEGST